MNSVFETDLSSTLGKQASAISAIFVKVQTLLGSVIDILGPAACHGQH